MIRVESVVDGSLVAQLPTGEAILWGRFLLAGEQPHLVYTNQEKVRIYELRAGAAKLTTELPESYVMTIMPTADPNTVLISHNDGATSVTPLNVATGKPGEQYQYVPPMLTQLFDSKQFPANTVRVVPAAPGGTSSIVQLVNPSTGEVVLASDPVEANPVQVVSFSSYVRNGGNLAVVPIGYNRAVVLDAASGETWEISPPVVDDRLWHFYPGMDGKLVTAYPEPPTGTSEYKSGYIAPLEPGTEWEPVDQGAVTPDTMGGGTPVPDSP